MAAPVTEAAIEKVRQLIIGGELGPGSRLPPEATLAERLGVSRSSAREAVRALVTARVLDVRRGDGTYVTSLRPQLLLDGIGFAVEMMRDDSALELIEVRRVLEPAVTALAADRATADHLQEIGASLGRMRRANGHEEFVRFDAEFHDLVGEASGNETLASMVRGVSSRSLRARVWRDILEADASERTMAEHERIYAALQARDSTSAQAAALLHVRSTELWLRQVLDVDRPQTS
ncbi:FadR/GntR family transcriptional regulator [Actinopolymorpha singaporensis]|uniref:DNA-binding transcriptional regulator, FadR family n=1 Tax=Actinopolymorpha singaporensis TaxID=117157 RepID=A0A1H1RQZ8_9ACTN|nr:FadR/GntR family transcriptional regulator [Actinopolymorpha singaporensis]SDS38042.1 DNA-binding transcriptional regulator, FadR family [Actinopolymorpha singaporensis]